MRFIYRSCDGSSTLAAGLRGLQPFGAFLTWRSTLASAAGTHRGERGKLVGTVLVPDQPLAQGKGGWPVGDCEKVLSTFLCKRVKLAFISALFSPLRSHPEHQPPQGASKGPVPAGAKSPWKKAAAELGIIHFPGTKPVQGIHVLTQLQAGRVDPPGDPRPLITGIIWV